MSAEDRVAPIGLTSPREAMERRLDDESNFDLRYLQARATVEQIMDAQFRGISFRVGFAAPPLGGGEAWIEEALVPDICTAAEAAGWITTIEGNFITFTAAPADSDA